MHFRVRSVSQMEGDIIVVPKGVERCPESHGDVDLMLFEPLTTVNTGNVACDRAIIELPRI